MGALEFTDGLVAHLAWPTLVLVLSVTFRRSLGELIGRIKGAKGAGVELDFSHEWNEVAKEIVPLAADIRQLDTGVRGGENLEESTVRGAGKAIDFDWIDFARRWRTMTPNRAVIGAYRELALELAHLIDAVSERERHPEFFDARILIEEAFDLGLVPLELMNSFAALNHLVALATSRPNEVSEAQAREFVLLIAAILNSIGSSEERRMQGSGRGRRDRKQSPPEAR